jgi:hypothetical protein
VSDEPVGGDSDRIKHLTTVEIDPIKLEVGMYQTDFLMKWIADSIDHNFARYSGAIHRGDFDLNCVVIHEFQDALISEVTFPTLDASSKDDAIMKVTINPERVKRMAGDGHKIGGTFRGRQKLWQASAFRLTIDGVDTKRVNKIESFTIKQGVKPVNPGEGRWAQLEPSKVEFPDLKITMPVAASGSMYAWFEEVVNGKGDLEVEKDGSIELLTPNRQEVCLRIDLYGVGVKGYNEPKSDAGGSAISRCTFDLYVSKMEISGDHRLLLET